MYLCNKEKELEHNAGSLREAEHSLGGQLRLSGVQPLVGWNVLTLAHTDTGTSELTVYVCVPSITNTLMITKNHRS